MKNEAIFQFSWIVVTVDWRACASYDIQKKCVTQNESLTVFSWPSVGHQNRSRTLENK